MVKCYIATVVDFRETSVKYHVFTDLMKCESFIHSVETRKETVTNPSSGQKTPRFSAFMHHATME